VITQNGGAAAEHGARLLTFDDHFADIDGLLRCEVRE
jgi:predicted nucleic acid-binding protein